ncbi:SGNH/GDSL hydrolase family protein [Egbenema bharatensis]|uniref:SGNH/GDSL hydrolase family protein n=1 Tax=Egbenema bharatensis TaxID=3463334 RepID=UPI003A898A8B
MRQKFFVRLALGGLCLALLLAALLNLGSSPRMTRLSELFRQEQSQPGVTDRAQPGIPPTVVDADRYGSGLRRTMNLLTSSTPEQQNTVKILFYGQSITRQVWWLELEDYLRQRFPNANLVVENRAIGGFDAPKLIRTAEHDLYSFYPDLMIFHVHGDEESYESIIANARQRTTTEILLVSDHITWMPEAGESSADRTRAYEWHNRRAMEWLPQLAQQYDCELVEIRQPWEQYLRSNGMTPSDLLADEDHLNGPGNALMANFITTHLEQMPIQPIAADPVQTYVVGSEVQWQQGRLELEFEGNRVDLIAADPGSIGSAASQSNFSFARVLIDGRPPSEANLYKITRPSDVFGVDQPAVMQVSASAALIPERWTAVITEINDTCDRFRFRVYGSETGFDGEGQNDRQFVSQSGRVVIEPQDWWIDDACQLFQIATPEGFQFHWRVEPLFSDVYVPPAIETASPPPTTTIAQGLPNQTHTLEIISPEGNPAPIAAIRVYRPPFRPEG